ncbi:hypothetical protein D9M73_235620 [compost metagenome]
MHEVVVGVGLVDEAPPGLVYRNHAGLGAVCDQVREALTFTIGMTQFGNRCPEKVGRQALALGCCHGLGKAQGGSVVGRW